VSRVRTRVLLPAVFGLLATLTACGAGQVSQTADQASAVNGYTGQAGQVAVRDASFAYMGQANNGAIYKAGQAAQLDASLVNVGAQPDKLLSVSSPIAAAGVVQGDATLGGSQTVVVGNNGAGASSLAVRNIRVMLVGLKQDIVAGRNYPVTFVFQRAGTLTGNLPVGYPTGPLAVRGEKN
jgi:periplasmic copper chaperone A